MDVGPRNKLEIQPLFKIFIELYNVDAANKPLLDVDAANIDR